LGKTRLSLGGVEAGEAMETGGKVGWRERGSCYPHRTHGFWELCAGVILDNSAVFCFLGHGEQVNVRLKQAQETMQSRDREYKSAYTRDTCTHAALGSTSHNSQSRRLQQMAA
jgi:hypothetical protein